MTYESPIETRYETLADEGMSASEVELRKQLESDLLDTCAKLQECAEQVVYKSCGLLARRDDRGGAGRNPGRPRQLRRPVRGLPCRGRERREVPGLGRRAGIGRRADGYIGRCGGNAQGGSAL